LFEAQPKNDSSQLSGGINMRLGTLMFGALLGAAGFYYLSNKGKNLSMPSVMNLMKDAGQSAQGITSKVASTVSSQSGISNEEGINQIKAIIEKDPALKASVNEILKHSGESATVTNSTSTVPTYAKATAATHSAKASSSTEKSSAYTQ
jgi:hypothetical protein